MKRRLTLAIALLLLAVAAIACGGSGDTANGGETVSPVVTFIATDDSPTTFEAARDDILAKLDAIGVNIGIVPDDIGEQLVRSCLALEAFVQGERVAEICASITDAIERGDPGLIDLVMERIADLEPD